MAQTPAIACTAEQIVDLIRAIHPLYFSRHAITMAEAIDLIEQYAAVVAGEAAIKATEASYAKCIAITDEALSAPLATPHPETAVSP